MLFQYELHSRLMFLAIDSRLHKERDIPPREQRKTHKPARCRKVYPESISGWMKLRCDDTQHKAQHHGPQGGFVEGVEHHLSARVPLGYPDQHGGNDQAHHAEGENMDGHGYAWITRWQVCCTSAASPDWAARLQ